MHNYVYIPLLASAVLAVLARPLARAGSPRAMTWLLVPAGVVVAGTSAFSMVLLTSTIVGQVPDVAAVGHWSVGVLSREDPVSRIVAVAAALVLAGVGVAVAQLFVNRSIQFVRARRVARSFGVAGDLLVVPDRAPIAHALPGGVVVVSAGMLRNLSRGERAVLLAHERAHVHQHHHVWRLVVDLCVRIDPMLYPVGRAVYGLTERWADEVAAVHVGDRQLVASALSRAADLTHSWRATSAGLAFGGLTIADRLAALAADPPKTSWWRVASLPALACVVVVSAFVAYNNLDVVYDAAQAATVRR